MDGADALFLLIFEFEVRIDGVVVEIEFIDASRNEACESDRKLRVSFIKDSETEAGPSWQEALL